MWNWIQHKRDTGAAAAAAVVGHAWFLIGRYSPLCGLTSSFCGGLLAFGQGLIGLRPILVWPCEIGFSTNMTQEQQQQ